MWQPKTIRIKNLMTHEDTTFEFKKNDCVMIFAINSTDAGSDSNGGGKSTVLEGITIAITGETNRGVTKEEFIRDGEEESYVEMELDNTLGDTKNLIIKRWFNKKKSAKVEVWENGIQNKELSSVNEANARVFELIGLSKEDLLHFFMIGQETNYSFLTSNDIDKKNIISRFSEVDYINTKIENLKINRKNIENDLDALDKKIQKVENKIEFLKESKDEIIANFEEENQAKIKRIEVTILNQKSLIKSKESIKEEKVAKVVKLKAEIENVVIKNDAKLNESLSDNRKKEKQINKDILEAENVISHLEAVYEGKITCPNCQHSFNPTEEIELSEIPVLINSANKLMIQKTNLLYGVEAAIKDDRKQINDNAVENERLISLKRILKSTKDFLDGIDDEITEHEKKISGFKAEIKELKLITSDEELGKLDSQIKEQDEAGEILYAEKGLLDQKILDIDFWVYHFGKKGFLTFLTNKSIKSIEGITNSYLRQMNSELQVLIDGYTVLKSGDVREKINISIVRGGIEIANFNRYSGGEKGRIKLANILGLQHLINLTAKNGGLNFLGLDEVFEGLDKTGQMDVLNILEKLNVTSLVITHRNQPIGAANEIFIEKIKGISRIIKK